MLHIYASSGGQEEACWIEVEWPWQSFYWWKCENKNILDGVNTLFHQFMFGERWYGTLLWPLVFPTSHFFLVKMEEKNLQSISRLNIELWSNLFSGSMCHTKGVMHSVNFFFIYLNSSSSFQVYGEVHLGWNKIF